VAVFTPIASGQLELWLSRFDLGRLLEFQGIAAGIENSNFFVTTERGRFVLTLFERLPASDLPFYLGLMHHLALRAIPCPDPIADRDGQMFGELNGKPAALVTRLAGRDVDTPDASHCRQIGELLAQMHLAARDYPLVMHNARGIAWQHQQAGMLERFLAKPAAALLREELQAQTRFESSALNQALTRSAVHADLFRDNVLFDGAVIGGVIDFYFAATDRWLFDLAIACNDWSIDASTGQLDLPRLRALLDGYQTVRGFDDAEREAWPMMLRAAAFRFWLSRLYDLHLPRPAQMVTPKDPAHFERILIARRSDVPPLN
jgi:homoserine kinase type II